jgi:hypothetical protein
MSIVDALQASGYKPEKSTAGDKPILKGVYKAMLTEVKKNEPNQYGQSISASFKITEKLSGNDSRSQFPEFRGFFAIDEANIGSAKKGLKKLLNGLFSVGVSVDTSSDEALMASLQAQVGVAEVYITAYKKKAMKQVDGNWVANDEADPKQDFTFMTQKNAEAEAKKQNAKNE